MAIWYLNKRQERIEQNQNEHTIPAATQSQLHLNSQFPNGKFSWDALTTSTQGNLVPSHSAHDFARNDFKKSNTPAKFVSKPKQSYNQPPPPPPYRPSSPPFWNVLTIKKFLKYSGQMLSEICCGFSWKRIYTISEFAPSRVVYYSLSIAICTSSCVSSIERRLDKSKKSLSLARYLEICERIKYKPAVHSLN